MSERQAETDRMRPERWQHVQDVFAAAIECEAGDRAAVLEAQCAGDTDLRREVESLLAAHEQTGPVDHLSDALAPVASWARAQTIGEGGRVGRYTVLDLVGAGGMGLVYRARDERLGRYVALKFLPPHLSADPEAKARFLGEARAAAALDHPNICTIHEIGESQGRMFIAMPVYDGETLLTRLRRGRLPFEEATPIALQIARGLGQAHERGIVHRDVKPSNVMLLADGTAKILDFGIAANDDRAQTGGAPAFGTIAYMSPEHVRGLAVDRRGDIWSLGIMLHEMLAGTRPFGGTDRQRVAEAILTQDPELIATSHPDVPAGTDDLLRRALAKRPDDRYASMAAFAADLAALLAAAGDRRAPGRVERPLTGTGQGQASPPASERRRTTVLVTLVSDYASLVERLTPVEADRLVGQIRDIAVDVVRRHGGLVNQAIGEEIVSLFGVPAAHDDDELRAVRAAWELGARVRAIALGAGPSGGVRVQSGLHVGPVVAQRLDAGPRRYGIVGAPAQLASRLAALAGPDDVLLSAECQRLVAPFIHTAPGRPVAFEADAAPVASFHVTGATGLETRLEASERSGLTPYVGRQSELALLEREVARARGGDSRFVLVVGEAGVGKSRLLYELRERLAAAPGVPAVRLLHGRCRAYGDVAPYAPLIEIVRDALAMRAGGVDDSTDIIARLRAIDRSLEPFLPLYLHLLSVPSESHPLPRHLQGEHLQAALLDALAALVAVLASRATLVVLLEDWHWADSASRAALGRMMEIVATCTLVFVVTTRPERSVVSQWPAAGVRVPLEPLDLDGSAAIMQAVLGVERVSGEFARRVFERTGGNPFFVEQVCCALVEQGAVAPKGGEAVIEGGAAALSLPDTVQAVIRTRLDNLEPRAREVLRVAAVIGREFAHGLLADLIASDIDLAPAMARLKASALIQQTSVIPEVGYRFTHVLTQEVSYDSLLSHQRASLHAAIGRAIETRHADRLDEQASLLAHHFCRAEEWPKAVRYGRRAADRASALSQFTDALATLDQLLDWLPHLPVDEQRRDLRADLLLEQERACETMGLRRRQQEIIGQLIAHLSHLGPSARLAQTYLREGDLLTLLKRFDTADRALSTALRISRDLGDAALERKTLRSIGLLRWHEGRHADALAITEHALAIDRECQDESAVAGDLTNLGNILKSMGEYGAALPKLEEALSLLAGAQDPKKLAYALHNLANVHRATGNAEAALTCLRRADEIAAAHLLPIQRSFHLTSIAHIDLQQGRIEQALATYRKAIDLSRRARHAEGLAQSLRTLGDVLFGLGRGDDALPYLLEAAPLFAQLEDPATEAEIWSHAAAVLDRTDRASESAAAWRRVHELCRQLGQTQGQLDALEGAARALRRLDEPPDRIVAAYESALALAETLGEDRRALSLRNALGILEWTRGRYAEALTHYETARRLVRTHGDRAQEGLILNSLGVTLSKLHRPEEARTALEESLTVSRETGERLLEAHALAALGQVFQSQQQPDRAVSCFEQSRELRRALGDRIGEGWMLRRMAEARAASRDEAGARDAAAGAAQIGDETGDVELIAACRAASRTG